MCRFKSGVVLKNRVVLAPIYNDSHSRLLESLGIEDTNMNAMKTFVRAELVPPNGDKTIDVRKWEYVVDQDVTPDWYDKDPQRYEEEFRAAVEEWMKSNVVIMCGKPWTPIKKDERGTYYLLFDSLEKSEFGKDNNYAKSDVRQKLAESNLANDLKKKFGDKLVSINVDLTSLDGLKDYGSVEDEVLSIINLDLYRECRTKIPNINAWYWLSTPDSTPSGGSSDCVQCVGSDGFVDYYWYNFVGAVRPLFILKSSIL